MITGVVNRQDCKNNSDGLEAHPTIFFLWDGLLARPENLTKRTFARGLMAIMNQLFAYP